MRRHSPEEFAEFARSAAATRPAPARAALIQRIDNATGASQTAVDVAFASMRALAMGVVGEDKRRADSVDRSIRATARRVVYQNTRRDSAQPRVRLQGRKQCRSGEICCDMRNRRQQMVLRPGPRRHCGRSQGRFDQCRRPHQRAEDQARQNGCRRRPQRAEIGHGCKSLSCARHRRRYCQVRRGVPLSGSLHYPVRERRQTAAHARDLGVIDLGSDYARAARKLARAPCPRDR